jgi:ketosteroid isomerase-like protein
MNTSRFTVLLFSRALLPVVAILAFSPVAVMADDLDDVRAADLRRISALIHADRPALDAVLADELSYGHSDGRVQTKAELLVALEGGAVTYQSYDGPSPVVRVHGNVATLSGTAELRATARGTRMQLWIRYLAVYVKHGDAWRLTDYQSTRLETPSSGRK